MNQQELERRIELARLDRSTSLDLSELELTSLPHSIGSLSQLTSLCLRRNNFTSLPESIGNLINLTELNLCCNRLTRLPESIGGLTNLQKLIVRTNQLTELPASIGNLSNLIELDLVNNQLTSVPESLGNLSNLKKLEISMQNNLTSLPDSIGKLANLEMLDLSENQLITLPNSIANLTNLNYLILDFNPVIDLSILQALPNLETVSLLEVKLPRKYWTKLSEWQSEWLLTEQNVEIRRVLIQELGYAKICQELAAIEIDRWREYILLKIDGIERFASAADPNVEVIESMVLLKMTCPSTAHIHVLRVPPTMTSAEAAITWVNHGIHPDKFQIQT